jgi:hypothetical protein
MRRGEEDFIRVVLDNLLKAGVQNTKKKERLVFTELKPWPGGRLIAAEGRYREGMGERAKESIPITTKRASSCAKPISLAATIPTSGSRLR